MMSSLPALVGSAAVIVAVYILIKRAKDKIVGVITDALTSVKASLTEASAEIVAKIEELESQLANQETVDPQLIEDVKTLATGLADLVPNETPTEPVDPVPNTEGTE